MYLLGYDIGSSSIKAALVEAKSGRTVAIKSYPDLEMEIISLKSGWAEQHPEVWWDNVRMATQHLLKETNINTNEIQGIGISYQMHGLVLLDKDDNVLRPSIIWCDSRAVQIGDQAFENIGAEKCLSHLLNSPGNFTASKLRWVKENEPGIYKKINKILLPGDYVALQMTGKTYTTVSGLSEAMLWDFKENSLPEFLLDYYDINSALIPEVVDTFSDQGCLSQKGAEYLGLLEGIPVTYRAGDQPNNAMSLSVLNPAEVAATGGTSGVVYGVVDTPVIDTKTRINSFAHVNHSQSNRRIGVLLCINGAGIMYSWMKQMLTEPNTSYQDIEQMAASVPVNADGLRILPFGNGAERVLENRNPGAQFINLQLNRHKKAHLFRAALEGVAFSYAYGIEVMKAMGMNLDLIRVGNDNLFQSEVFSTTLSNVLDCEIQMMDTTGAVGAAKAAGVGCGVYKSVEDAFKSVELIKTFLPTENNNNIKKGYQLWKSDLEHYMT